MTENTMINTVVENDVVVVNVVEENKEDKNMNETTNNTAAATEKINSAFESAMAQLAKAGTLIIGREIKVFYMALLSNAKAGNTDEVVRISNTLNDRITARIEVLKQRATSDSLKEAAALDEAKGLIFSAMSIIAWTIVQIRKLAKKLFGFSVNTDGVISNALRQAFEWLFKVATGAIKIAFKVVDSVLQFAVTTAIVGIELIKKFATFIVGILKKGMSTIKAKASSIKEAKEAEAKAEADMEANFDAFTAAAIASC